LRGNAVAQALPGTADLVEKSGPREMATGAGEVVARSGEMAERDGKMAATAGATATAAAGAVRPLSLRQCSTQLNPRIAGR
jgi:hypothetical protein